MGENLYDAALKAVQELHGDTSVSVSETVTNLLNLIEEIRTMIDTLAEE